MRRQAFVIVLSLVVAALASVGVVSCGAPLPSVIRDEMARSPRGTATIVFFTDFQCPFCRRTHAALAPILAARGDRVRVVFHHVPLPSHPDARGAARAAICVEELAPPAVAASFASALFTTQDLSDEGCESLAVARGVDRERLRACVRARATDERIDRDTALLFGTLDGDGVPVLFIGGSRLEGAQPASVLERAIDDAIARAR